MALDEKQKTAVLFFDNEGLVEHLSQASPTEAAQALSEAIDAYRHELINYHPESPPAREVEMQLRTLDIFKTIHHEDWPEAWKMIEEINGAYAEMRAEEERATSSSD